MLKCIEGGALLGVGVAVPEDVDGMLGTELALGRWPARQGEPGIDSTDISEGVAVRFWGVAERSKSPWEQIRIVLQYAEKMWTKEESLRRPSKWLTRHLQVLQKSQGLCSFFCSVRQKNKHATNTSFGTWNGMF